MTIDKRKMVMIMTVMVLTMNMMTTATIYRIIRYDVKQVKKSQEWSMGRGLDSSTNGNIATQNTLTTYS